MDPTTHNSAAFFRALSGIVHLRGLVAVGIGGATSSFPPGYFPPKARSYIVATAGGAPAEVLISTTGEVSRVSLIAGRISVRA